MEEDVPSALVPAIKDIVHHLITGNFAELIEDGPAAGWTEDVLRGIVAEIEEKEGRLVDVPDAAFEEPIAVAHEDGSGWRLDVDLWTERDISMYTLNLEARVTAAGPQVHMEDLRIM